MKPHPHAKLMMLYAQDAQETDKPWERWEFYSKNEDIWQGLVKHPMWRTDALYRRKPKMRALIGIAYPEPERSAPEEGVWYWYPAAHGFLHQNSGLTGAYRWRGDEIDDRMLRRGAVHLTKEAAEAHARAIILAGGGEI